jgi:hypothetical protein
MVLRLTWRCGGGGADSGGYKASDPAADMGCQINHIWDPHRHFFYGYEARVGRTRLSNFWVVGLPNPWCRPRSLRGAIKLAPAHMAALKRPRGETPTVLRDPSAPGQGAALQAISRLMSSDFGNLAVSPVRSPLAAGLI